MSGDRNSAIGTLTVLQGRSLGYARDDGEALSKFRGASDFYALHHPRPTYRTR